MTLVAVPHVGCVGCVFNGDECDAADMGEAFPCRTTERADGVQVIWVVKGAER